MLGSMVGSAPNLPTIGNNQKIIHWCSHSHYTLKLQRCWVSTKKATSVSNLVISSKHYHAAPGLCGHQTASMPKGCHVNYKATVIRASSYHGRLLDIAAVQSAEGRLHDHRSFSLHFVFRKKYVQIESGSTGCRAYLRN